MTDKQLQRAAVARQAALKKASDDYEAKCRQINTTFADTLRRAAKERPVTQITPHIGLNRTNFYRMLKNY